MVESFFLFIVNVVWYLSYLLLAPLHKRGARFPGAGVELNWLRQFISTLPVHPLGVGPHVHFARYMVSVNPKLQ